MQRFVSAGKHPYPGGRSYPRDQEHGMPGEKQKRRERERERERERKRERNAPLTHTYIRTRTFKGASAVIVTPLAAADWTPRALTYSWTHAFFLFCFSICL
jgi:hypothetical protein